MKAILLRVQTPDDSDISVQKSFAELELLLEGLGYAVESRVIQKRPQIATSSYVGEGKIQELSRNTGGCGIVPKGPEFQSQLFTSGREDLVVVVDDELSPTQFRYLEASLGVKILDRVTVILKIFEARARSREAKLEVELAKLIHEMPRIRDDHSLGDREGGGGRASRGHSNVELAKMRTRERMAQIRKELEQLKQQDENRMRSRSDTFSVAIVGYTNAGKSSLMKLLTGSDVLVENKLFATLGTTTRQLTNARPTVLITDTVGFLDRLPHTLLASFRSTLAEARDCWLIAQLIDVADPDWRRQYGVTQTLLQDLELDAKPAIVILNKVDRLSDEERSQLKAEMPDALQISALNPADGQKVKDAILKSLAGNLKEESFSVPYAKQGILAELRQQLQVLSEDYGATIQVKVRARPDVLAKFRSSLKS